MITVELESKTHVTLVYPYFQPQSDNSIFRFPPLGLGYIASYLKQNGISVNVVDCTFFTNQNDVLKKIRDSKPSIIGIQSMFSMKQKSLEMARLLRNDCQLLVAGGPLPTTIPEAFLDEFDVVVIGEGEQTMLELVKAFDSGTDFSQISGIVYKHAKSGEIKHTCERNRIRNLDVLPFPLRKQFNNSAYKKYYLKKFGYTITTIMTSRGCPYMCDFCSKPIFGNEFIGRSVTSLVDEIEELISLGYDRVWFADDCFTLNKHRLKEFCDEIMKRRLKIGWECLSRVDTLDSEIVRQMKQAGCLRIFFGIESGDDAILAIMRKNITVDKAKEAVQLCNEEGVKVGAFFILGYPGENGKTLLNTIKFASSLNLDYLSFTLPFPIPGTPLFERLKEEIAADEYAESNQVQFIKQKLLFRSNLSESKLKLAIIKGMTNFYIQKYLGRNVGKLITLPFNLLTDEIYKVIR